MSQGMTGKVVLIAGGSTGIGAETARLLASRGAKVAVAARRQEKLDDVVSGIASTGGSARSYKLDVTDKRQVETVVAAVVAEFGRLDVLINNAGLMPIRPMAEVNTDEWDAMIDVNIKGTLYGIAAALRYRHLSGVCDRLDPHRAKARDAVHGRGGNVDAGLIT